MKAKKKILIRTYILSQYFLDQFLENYINSLYKLRAARFAFLIILPDL